VPINLQHPKSQRQQAKTANRKQSRHDDSQRKAIFLLLIVFVKVEHGCMASSRRRFWILQAVLRQQ